MLDLSFLDLRSPLDLCLFLLNLEISISFINLRYITAVAKLLKIVFMTAQILLSALENDVELIWLVLQLLLWFVKSDSSLHNKSYINFVLPFSEKVSLIFKNDCIQSIFESAEEFQLLLLIFVFKNSNDCCWNDHSLSESALCLINQAIHELCLRELLIYVVYIPIKLFSWIFKWLFKIINHLLGLHF